MFEGLDRLIANIPGDTGDLTGVPSSLHPLVAGLIAGPAPRDSLIALRRLWETHGELDWPQRGTALTAVAAVLSSGPELNRLLLRRRDRFEILTDSEIERPRTKEELVAELANRVSPSLPIDEQGVLIAAFRNDHYLRLAACEFGLRSLEEVSAALSDLADACVDHALRACIATVNNTLGTPHYPNAESGSPTGMTAIAMGKYGARELNFCSDLDLIFIYGTDDGVVTPPDGGTVATSIHEYHSTIVRKIVAVLSTPTDEGFSFRIDLRLRPEGSRGPICNAIAAAESYYETWGGPYDRLSWLKARSAAGDHSTGDEIIRSLKPFVFPRTIRTDVVADVRNLSRRIQREVVDKETTPGWNVKLGRGGIRDIEFFVQALQLVHGGQQPVLQAPSSLAALDRLLFAGLINAQEHQTLTEAYDLYRRIEHRAQLHAGRQTHFLPASGPLRDQIVLHLAIYNKTPASLNQTLGDYQEQVVSLYASLEGTAPSQDEHLEQLIDQRLPTEEAAEVLLGLGFAHPEWALDQLERLHAKPWGPFGHRPSATLHAIRCKILTELAASPDPDAAFSRFVDLSLRFGPFDGIWKLLSEKTAVLRLLCNLFGTSDFFGRMFVNHPELIDQLLGAGRAKAERDPDELSMALRQQLKRTEDQSAIHGSGDSLLEEQLNALRRFRNAETLRVGLHDIAGDLDIEAVPVQLARIAETILAELYPIMFRAVAARYGTPQHEDGTAASMAILGLGGLGAYELSYGSDLDLIFVYSGQGKTTAESGYQNSEFFARLAQRLIGALTARMADGRLYEVDARLRPSGNQGALVCSVDSFRDYHRKEAQLWEHQALLRAKSVAGDQTIGEQIIAEVGKSIFHQQQDRSLRTEIYRMRQRIEAERAPKTPRAVNLKASPGGILDIQFIVQYLQLRNGLEFVQLRNKSTVEVLRALSPLGLLSVAESETLIHGYRFLRRLEARLRMVLGRSADDLPRSPGAVETIARRLGYRRRGDDSAGDLLLGDYDRQTAIIRKLYNALLIDDAHNP